MREVAIVGIGMTKFGELWDMSFREMGIQAGLMAMQDAKISAEEIDALYVGNMSAGRYIEQEHVAALMADYSGLARDHIPAIRIEAAGASGGLALRQAYLAIASGMHDAVVVGGAEKMTDVGDAISNKIQSSASDQQWESVFGATSPSLHAMIARRHMHEYGTTREQLAEVAVKNHRHGALNPFAQFQKEIDIKTVLRAGMVAEPLGMFDCAPNSDGAAALVLCSMERAKKYTDSPVRILASAQASDTLALHSRADICTFEATRYAAQRAYRQAGISPKDVQVAEVHDNFTISEILAIEDLGFFEKGQGGRATADGQTSIGGKVAVNTSGGLKARGDPIGATGIAQLVEIVQQLRGEAGKRQVSGASCALAHNVGGTGSTAVVHILGVK
ncbi:MAG: thiolase domain-containing protein [Methanomassiliicoccales archaeon]|nr:MAG: thiolase domain-containing protein [Methanomassiliicoccales archaeon]